MKIGIDARMIEHSGIGMRLYFLLHFLQKTDHKLDIYLFGNSEKVKRNGLGSYPIIEYDPPIYSLPEMFGHPKMKEMDILDIPHFNVPIKYISKCIVTVHDIIPYIFKDFFPEKKKQIYIRIILNLIKYFSKKVICVSQFTKQDLIDKFQFHSNQISVIYNAVDHSIFLPSLSSEDLIQFRNTYNLPSTFLLTVGIGKEHKNLDFVIRNLSYLWKQNLLSYPLVIAGSGGKIPEYVKPYMDENSDKIFICPKIDTAQFPKLYQSAKALLYPSLYEGFGFPVIEAQACGCPVFSSNASVLPEILQDTAFFFDPKNDQSFQGIILTTLSSEALLRSKIKAGIANAQKFQWSDSVTKLTQLFSSLQISRLFYL